ncbi:hypothetical protein B0H16DRAFT_1318971 [Mycena metata]|uniref:BTB domain-containing protein n=1 Tax=Mycena metata TaxID=1033252 RepID=A0AAD7N7E6_9AGAR|nr:hypothetical protein B0H16DRAFT_1318971 [Mycena metata]
MSHPSPVEGLWFDDGTLVLQAGNWAFRVYGGFLAQRSPVFHDMLQFPQPVDCDTMDSCPVVQLSDDKRDLEYFLRALFDHEFFPPYPAKTEFRTISGVLRLSTKYQVDSLRKRALIHLSSYFPSDPVEYPTVSDSSSWILEGPEWLRVVLLGKEMGLDWILPLAFYRTVAYCSAEQILNGAPFDEEVNVELDAADKLLCLEQSIALTTSASSAVIDFLWEPSVLPGCEGRDDREQWKCTKSRYSSRKMMEKWRSIAYPLKLWVPEDWADLSPVCGSCLASMKTAHTAAVRLLWDSLPQRFGLGDWATLEQIKANALEGSP